MPYVKNEVVRVKQLEESFLWGILPSCLWVALQRFQNKGKSFQKLPQLEWFVTGELLILRLRTSLRGNLNDLKCCHLGHFFCIQLYSNICDIKLFYSYILSFSWLYDIHFSSLLEDSHPAHDVCKFLEWTWKGTVLSLLNSRWNSKSLISTK